MICSTNRSLGNFSEYALKSSENQRFSSPKFFATQKTFLNANIMCSFAFGSQINKFAPSSLK
jgi:hypothetical protein